MQSPCGASGACWYPAHPEPEPDLAQQVAELRERMDRLERALMELDSEERRKASDQ